jgi:hypothetical protein
MELHPEQHVSAVLEAHRRTLAIYHDLLDRAVPKAYAKWESEYPDGYELPGETLCISVRTLVWKLAEEEASCSATLRVAELPPSSHQLVDGEGNSIRIRRHPWQHREWRRVPVTPPERDTLWGPDPTPLSYSLAILWDPSPKTKALDSAFLAAVSDLDTSSVSIYYRAALPVLSSSESTDSARYVFDGLETPDDFEDFELEEYTDEDPA